MPIIFGRQHTITTDDVFRVEKWSKDVTHWRENSLVMGKWVKRFDVGPGTQLIRIPNLTRPPAPGTITANGDVTDTTPDTEGEVVLNLDQRVGYIVNLPDDLMLQTTYNLESEHKESYGKRIGESVEANLLGLQDGFTENAAVGSSAADISIPVILKAWTALRRANAPLTDNHLVVESGQYEALLDTDKVTQYNSVAYPVAQSPIVNGEIGQIFGFRCAASNLVEVAAEGGYGNLAFQREAIAFGVLRDVKTEMLARVHFADRIGISMFYGFVELRGNHGVRVLSRA